MIFTNQKSLGKNKKVLGIEKTPPPPLGKIPKKSRISFWVASLSGLDGIGYGYGMEISAVLITKTMLKDNIMAQYSVVTKKCVNMLMISYQEKPSF